MALRRTTIIGIIVAIVIIPVGIYTISPLFLSKTVNEPAPIIENNTSGRSQNDGSSQFQQFMTMSEQERLEKGRQMSTEQKEAIMRDAASTEQATINEGMPDSMTINQASILRSGVFIGVNDGIHNAEGNVKVIQLANGSSSVLRLEDFRSTNGPDLYVYLSTDKSATDFVNLGRLKGNIGNQNYEIPLETDLDKYDTVLIWCKAFSVLFGSAELSTNV